MGDESSRTISDRQGGSRAVRQCPYLDTTHSTAELRYLCKVLSPVLEIDPAEYEKYRCRGYYSGCLRYQKRDG